ncbi:MAG: YkgJ family cysteine cluster protein [Planctomycetota bacterium]|jgi:Fe-S-cluster containining protein
MSESEPASSAPRKWYEDGLPFACTQCGHCCRIEGYVWMSTEEIARVAEHLGLDVDTFGERYLMRVGKRWSLKEKPNFDCVFWDEGCTIYPVRPTQCRTFPFWPENLRKVDQWLEVVEECPGSGSGRVYSYEEIELLRLGIGETGGAPPSAGGPIDAGEAE